MELSEGYETVYLLKKNAELGAKLRSAAQNGESSIEYTRPPLIDIAKAVLGVGPPIPL